MTILKFLTLFLILYATANITWWGWQEYIHYEATQNIRSLDNTININYSVIEEMRLNLEKEQININKEKETLDELFSSKKIAQYNEFVPKYNKSVDDFNAKKAEYDALVETHNLDIRQINDLITKTGTRTFIFPIQPYTPPLIPELK
jgi:hypothetical protein